MSGSVDDPTLVEIPTAEPRPEETPRHRRRPFRRRDSDDGSERPPDRRRVAARVAAARRRGAEAIVIALPTTARVLTALGALILSFAVFVTVFGGLRHTSRQDRLDRAFRARVAGGHADRPNWGPLPGQAIATISIPAIDLFEVVVEDTTVDLLKGGPGHLLGTPLPGQRGNVVVLGRRLTDGAPFRDLDELSRGDRITAVTPSGAFVYAIEQVVRVAPGATEAFEPTEDARMTLVTSASALVPGDRTVVVATMSGTPVTPARTPVVQQLGAELGASGDPDALPQVLLWTLALALGLLIWARERRRIGSRWYRFLIGTPPVLVLLFFLFENAENLLPGSI